MNIPKPPWYGAIDKKLKGAEWLVNALLIGIILISIVLLLRGDRLTRTAWLVYLVSP
jgi:hypothetical protein